MAVKDYKWRLLDNARDSVSHALDHYRALEEREGARADHSKWIIISAHHATHCFLMTLLMDVAPELFPEHGNWPSCSGCIKKLGMYEGSGELSGSELRLLKLVSNLDQMRHDLTHKYRPDDYGVKPSHAAWCILALFTAARLRYGVDWSVLLTDHDPDPLRFVAEQIHVQSHDDYSAYVEEVVEEERPHTSFEQCLWCGTVAVAEHDSRCPACFIELEWLTCPSCELEFPIPSQPWSADDEVFQCPACDIEVRRC